MFHVRLIALALFGCVALLATSVTAAPASAQVHSNTQARLPSNLYLADINGDGRADLLQVAANKLFAFNTDYTGTPILHKYFDQNISRLFVGDFTISGREHGKDQVCAVFVDGTLACYAISDDGTDLWWWFSQGSFIASDEEAIVGDFDGDGAADVLVYKPSTGDIRLYTLASSGFFQPMPGFSLGNLATADRVNKRLLAGEFGQASNRADLLLLDPASGQVSRYDTATDSTGHKTFWWAFTTAGGAVSTEEEVHVARIENSVHDGIVLRNRATGAIRLKQAEYASGSLANVVGVNTGQLPRSTDNASLHFAKTVSFKELGGTIREDALFFDFNTGQLSKYDARWDGFAYSYWWAYSKSLPAMNVGWTGVTHDPWTVVMCKFADVSALPQSTTFWRNHFTAGTGGVADYFWDMSYGSRELYGTRVIGPYTMSLQLSAATARAQTAQSCKNAATAAGVSVPDSKVIYYVNSAVDDGNSGGIVVADPSLNSPMALGHEMSHVYGVNDSANDQGGWYGDPYDIMSAMQGYCFDGPTILASSDNVCYSLAIGSWVRVTDTASGPGLDAGNRIAEGLLPGGRTRQLIPGSARQSVSLDLTGLDRPEASVTATGAVQTIRIPIASGALPECVAGNTCKTSGNYYTVELREPRGWDSGFARSTVFVHKVGVTNDKTQTYLMTSPMTEFTAGTTYQDAAVTIRVNSIDTAHGVANVTVTY